MKSRGLGDGREASFVGSRPKCLLQSKLDQAEVGSQEFVSHLQCEWQAPGPSAAPLPGVLAGSKVGPGVAETQASTLM